MFDSMALVVRVIGAAVLLAGAPVPTPTEPTMISLADSIEPLRERFNAERGKPRFIAILSPT